MGKSNRKEEVVKTKVVVKGKERIMDLKVRIGSGGGIGGERIGAI